MRKEGRIPFVRFSTLCHWQFGVDPWIGRNAMAVTGQSVGGRTIRISGRRVSKLDERRRDERRPFIP